MSKFKGFGENETFTGIPDVFFQKILNEIEDPAELKVTLYALWRIAHIEGAFHALCPTDFEAQALGLTAEAVTAGLEKAVQRGSLLKAEHEADVFYFLNSPRGRAAAEAFRQGDWRASARISSTPPVERPNIYKLYEENIGPLTAMIADKLKDAEETYSQEWLADAIERSVAQNVRKWNYIEAILKRWKEEGRAEKQDRRDNEKDRRRYVEGDFADFVEH